MNLRRWTALLLAACMMTACTAFAESWAKENGLDKTETVEALYQAALLEGELNLYGCTGRDETVGKSFEAAYPGIKVNFYDLGINEMLEKFSREHEAGVYTADVLQLKEQSGSVARDYIAQGLLHNYQPADIYEGLEPSWLSVTPFVIELDWWNYNTEVYDKLPIASWWDLVKPEWNGKFIFLDPTGEPDLIVLFTAMIQHADLMAKDYERVFGQPIELAADEPTAAHAWIKRVAQNGVIIESSNTNIVKDVGGSAGMSDPPIGYGVSSKLRERDQQGYVLGVNPSAMEDETPSTAIRFMIVQVADKAPHPNAAKLFVRFIAGEKDHDGEGIKPFLSAGSYPVFPGVNTEGIDQPDFESIPMFKLDLDYYYDHYYDVYDYWISVQP